MEQTQPRVEEVLWHTQELFISTSSRLLARGIFRAFLLGFKLGKKLLTNSKNKMEPLLEF